MSMSKNRVHYKGGGIKYKPLEIKAKIEKYFSESYIENEDGTKLFRYHPSLIGLKLYLNLSTNTFMKYMQGAGRYREHGMYLQEAKERILEHNIQQLYRREQVTGVIFNLKNTAGWTEKTDVRQQVTGNINLGSLLDRAEEAELIDSGQAPEIEDQDTRALGGGGS
jgi:hypothetical protein